MSNTTVSSQTQKTTPRIAIIGGGPGGLVLLLTLYKRGIPATLYEREASADSRANLGGMLDLEWETGQRALRENGLEDAFVKNSRREAEEMRMCGKDGVPLLHVAGADPSEDLKKSRPEIDRRVLRKILLDAVPAGLIKWGHALSSIKPLEGGRHEFTFTNGVVTVADYVVGADGARSRVRPLVSSAVSTFTGLNGAELLLPPELVALPENKDISDGVGQGSCYNVQDRKSFSFQRNGSGHIRAYAWHYDSEDWTLPKDPKEAKRVLLEIYSGWAPWIRKFIQIADDSSILPRPLYHLPVGHRWDHKPGVTLIGDAAHQVSPFAGAGANLAMVDGLNLGIVLADAVSKGLNLEAREAAIAAWEEESFVAVEKVAKLSAGNLELVMGDGAPQTAVEAFKRTIPRH
ncbi:monooxygenase FAD-binding protein [Trametes polyzona]|nr:monooxygenase FAD-binding protein [Trametes polyzona]